MFKKLKRIKDEPLKGENKSESIISTKVVMPSYSEHVFELSNQIENETQSLLKEEGYMTTSFNSLLNGTGYTTEQIQNVQTHLENLSKNSEHNNEVLKQVFTSLETSTQKVDDAKCENLNMVNQMDSVIKMFEQFIDLFGGLQSQYKKIESFATIISDIANETNLLSLNASIEAARAGEQGRGFSVVASEIKKLSEVTQQNAKDIMASLQSMTQSISQLSDKSKEGSDMVSDTTELIKNSTVYMDNIISAEGDVYKYLKEVKVSQDSNQAEIEKINNDLINILTKSSKDSDQFEALVLCVQKKADYFLHILHYLNQIKILREQSIIQ